jgi:hypothetical protein
LVLTTVARRSYRSVIRLKEQLAADPIERDKPQLVDLCGAPHKSTNATPAVMSSRREAQPTTSLPIRSRTSH